MSRQDQTADILAGSRATPINRKHLNLPSKNFSSKNTSQLTAQIVAKARIIVALIFIFL